MPKRKGWKGERKRHAKAAKGIKTGRKKRPKKIGSVWHGPSAIHGPRLRPPKDYKRIWVSKAEWQKKAWLTDKEQKKIKDYAKKQGLILPKNFPKTTQVKVGFTKKGKMKPQSFLTPVKHPKNYGSFFRKNKKDIVAMTLPGGTPLEFSKEEKKKFKIKEENFGDWTDIDKWQRNEEKLREVQKRRDEMMQAKLLRESMKKNKEKQMRLT